MISTEQRVVIIGFMGSGKTTIAEALARDLKCEWIDLDELIGSYVKRSPDEIIRQNGESKFREVETSILRKALSLGSWRVIAAGGGAWTIDANRKLIAENGALTVWLDAPFDLCWKRIEDGGVTRPLASSREAALKLYDERRSVYELADMRIKVDEEDSPEEIASRIAGTLP